MSQTDCACAFTRLVPPNKGHGCVMSLQRRILIVGAIGMIVDSLHHCQRVLHLLWLVRFFAINLSLLSAGLCLFDCVD